MLLSGESSQLSRGPRVFETQIRRKTWAPCKHALRHCLHCMARWGGPHGELARRPTRGVSLDCSKENKQTKKSQWKYRNHLDIAVVLSWLESTLDLNLLARCSISNTVWQTVYTLCSVFRSTYIFDCLYVHLIRHQSGPGCACYRERCPTPILQAHRHQKYVLAQTDGMGTDKFCNVGDCHLTLYWCITRSRMILTAVYRGHSPVHKVNFHKIVNPLRWDRLLEVALFLPAVLSKCVND